MQKTKKMLALLLVLVFSFALLIPTASADTFSDVPSTYRYYDAINSLVANNILNGYEDGTFKPDQTITRAEFAKVICLAQNVDVNVAGTNSSFTDVAPDHWAASYITLAQAMGIINGMGDGTFLPENPVTYDQAVKMVVCSIGYGLVAEKSGIEPLFPQAYLNVASRFNFLKGISEGAVNEPASRGLVCKLVDNMMGINRVDESTGEIVEGDTINSSVMNSDKVNGQVTAVYGTALEYGRTSPCGRNQIEIETNSGKEIFSIENWSGKSNVNDYLGKLVTVYYKEESGVTNYEVTSISNQKNRNITTKIDIDNIEDYSNTEIEYYPDEDSDTEKIDIDSGAYVLYNGVATNKTIETLLNDNVTNSGEITLIDTQNSGSADVVFVKTYQNIVVNAISSNDYKIYDKYDTSKAVVLDEKDRDKTITFKRDGSTGASFSSISKGDIVSVSISGDSAQSVIDVLIASKSNSKNKVTGTISQVFSNDKVEINNKEYKIAASYPYPNELTLNTSGTFYLDSFGKIAEVEIGTNTTFNYGYLTFAETDSKGGSSLDASAIQLQLFKLGSSSSVSTHYLADTVKIDGVSYKVSTKAKEIMELLRSKAQNPVEKINPVLTIKGETITPEEAEYSQIIKYSMKGTTIDQIITQPYYFDENGDLQEKEFVSFASTMKLNTDYLESGIKCTSSGKLDSRYTVNSSTKVIYVPADRSATAKYKVSNGSTYFRTGETYYLQLIDIDGYTVKAAVVFGGAGNASDFAVTDTPMIVTSTGTKRVTINGEESNLPFITVKKISGEEIDCFDNGVSDTSIDDLVPGDVVRVSLDSDNVIQNMDIVAVAADVLSESQKPGVTVDGTVTDGSASYHVGIGTVDDYDNGTLAVALAYVNGNELDTSKINTVNITGSTKVYTVDTSKSKVQINESLIEDVQAFKNVTDNTASKVLIYSSYNSCKLVIIFK